ncbi:MAG: FtsX-like permease family protein [Wenzhouxiangella sp.]|nr:MAG: FtsX-like permease family protein [Wenzhouxiangella sp.]
MIAGFLVDLRHAVRVYRKTPWQTALAVLMLASAMALVSTMAGLWSELNLDDNAGLVNDRGLVTIGQRGDMPMGVLSANGVRELKAASQTLMHISGGSLFGGLGDIELEGRTLEGVAEPVLPDYFETVQPRLALGRGLTEEDFSDDGAYVLVLSHQLWQAHFDGDMGIIGREVEMADQRWRIVGVADPEFNGLSSNRIAFWLPYRRFMADLQQGMPLQMVDDFPFFRIVARRASGTGLGAVEEELRNLVVDLPRPAMGQPLTADRLLVVNGIVDNPEAQRAAQRQTNLLLAAAVLIALVAAVNIGIFLLARAPTRRRELALRQAVGAGRRRLAGQLLVEAALLVVAATGLGLVLSIWLALAFRELDLFEQIELSGGWLDWPALGFSAGLAALLTALVALVPMALIRQRRLSEDARQISARPGRFQHAAGLVQLGLAGLVGAVALGFLAHLWLLGQRDLGLQPDRVTVATVSLESRPTGSAIVMPDAAAIEASRSAIRDRIGSLPGVEVVAFASPLPGQRMISTGNYEIEGEQINARMVNVSPGVVEALGLRLLHGRDFESENEPGMIVSRRFAETAWGQTDVVGRFVREGDAGRVIGVVDDVQFRHPDMPAEPIVLATQSGMAGFMASIIIRGRVDPDLVEARINEGLALIMDDLRVHRIRGLDELLGELTVIDRARARVTALFGVVIVLMAAFGFFAMQRFLVASGRREIAVHMALGAGPSSVRRRVVFGGLKLGLPGLVFGTLLGLIAVTWLTNDLVSTAVSPLHISAVTALGLLLVMLVSTLQPAWRAARLSPGALLKDP